MSLCVCGHTEGAHRSIPPHRCQHYIRIMFTGKRCACHMYIESGDRWQFEPESEQMRDCHDSIRLPARKEDE